MRMKDKRLNIHQSVLALLDSYRIYCFYSLPLVARVLPAGGKYDWPPLPLLLQGFFSDFKFLIFGKLQTFHINLGLMPSTLSSILISDEIALHGGSMRVHREEIILLSNNAKMD